MSLLFKLTLAALVLVALLTTWPKVLGDNDASRFATVQSLVEQHTFRIDNLQLADTGDKVFVDGHFYSDKLPLPSVLGAAVYLPLFLLGLRLGPGLSSAAYLVTLVIIKGLWLAGLIAFYDALGFTRLDERMRVALTLALGLASLFFTYTSAFNNHTVAGSFLIIGFDMLLRAARRGSERRHVLLAGLCLALAACADAPSAVFYAGGLAYVVTDFRLRRAAGYYLAPLLVTAAPTLALNYAISGSLVPVGMVQKYFLYPGSPWLGAKSASLSGTGINRGTFLLRYAFNCLFGRKGFILYNPLLLLAIPLVLLQLRRGSPFRREAWFVGLGSTVVAAYYLLFTNNYGGWSYSVRFLVPLLPLLFYFVHPFLEAPAAGRKAAFGVLAGLGFCIAAIGVINPWSFRYLNETPLVANLMQLRDEPGSIFAALAGLIATWL